MQHTLLSLRLMLQHGRAERGRTRVGEPVLAVDTRRVAAAWSCGCVAIGPTFEGLSWIACDAHELALDRHALGARNHAIA
jgi:hypothetical protein